MNTYLLAFYFSGLSTNPFKFTYKIIKNVHSMVGEMVPEGSTASPIDILLISYLQSSVSRST